PEVEDALAFRTAREEKIDIDYVRDGNEIALLLAGRKTAAAFKKPRPAIPPELAIQLVDHGSHAPLVRFPRSVHVEVAQACDGARSRWEDRTNMVVKDKFGLAVQVQRSLVL